MVTRMPGSNLFTRSTDTAVGRSRTPSSSSKGSNSHSTYATVTARIANTRSLPTGESTSNNSNSNNNNSIRSTGSNSSRKMNRGSFRRTLMLQKTKRSHSEKKSAGASEGNSTHSDTDTNRPLAEEREAGSGSPTLLRDELPRDHVETILKLYHTRKGSLDLYRDVLLISPDASDREIRIAYFRRGREILGDDKNSASKLDVETKSRFQAVSMAYEILSTPAWKEAYRKQGGLLKKISRTSADKASAIKEEAFDPFSSPSRSSSSRATFPEISQLDANATSAMFTPVLQPPQQQTSIKQGQRSALRKSSFIARGPNSSPPRQRAMKRSSSSVSVRWKDHVEELVFVKHPGEHGYDSDDSESDGLGGNDINVDENNGKFTSADADPNNNNNSNSTRGSSSSRRRRKIKPKIVIDSEELESHLKRMDSEAEKHFVQDFWDNFEESMDGILSLVDSLGAGSTNKRASTRPKRTIRNQDTTIGRSLSHDMTIDHTDNKESPGIPRSSSLPIPRRTSVTTLDAISPSPIPVTPDEKDRKATTSPSPYDMILNSWPFQAGSNECPEDQDQEPAIVSPTPTKMSSPSRSNHDASTSMASSILSTNNPSQQLFRPISPTLSEASEQVNSEFAFSEMSDKKAVDDSISSNAFELESRLSEMESLDLTELDNPFRSNQSLVPDVQQTLSAKSAGRKISKRKKNRFKVSMMTRIRGSPPAEKVLPSPPPAIKTVKSNDTSSEESTIEDVFAGVEEVSSHNQQRQQQQQQETKYDMATNARDPLQVVQDISIERSASQMSDLSASIYPSEKEIADTDKDEIEDIVDEDGGTSLAGKTKVETSNVTVAAPSKANSVLSESTKKSLLDAASNNSNNKNYAATDRSAGFSSYTSSTHTNRSAQSSMLELEDSSGTFFEYFLAYASAVMTECASLGATSTSAEYQKDFMEFFYGDKEVREQPGPLCRVPSESTRSSSLQSYE